MPSAELIEEGIWNDAENGRLTLMRFVRHAIKQTPQRR
jgi:hypothetical protein